MSTSPEPATLHQFEPGPNNDQGKKGMEVALISCKYDLTYATYGTNGCSAICTSIFRCVRFDNKFEPMI